MVHAAARGWHVLDAQVRPPVHAFGQEPQCSGSDVRSAQVLPQVVRPGGQVHEPVQTCVASHAIPQPPQCIGEVLVSTHDPPQRNVPLAHSHIEELQTSLVPHATVHDPQ